MTAVIDRVAPLTPDPGYDWIEGEQDILARRDNHAYAARAAGEIARRGLHHGCLIDHDYAGKMTDAPVCVLGGLAAAYFHDPLGGYEAHDAGYNSLVVDVATSVVGFHPDGGGPHRVPNITDIVAYRAMCQLHGWNDEKMFETPVRTTEEVVDALRAYAAAPAGVLA